MDLGGLRGLVRDLNFQAHGVPALVAGVSTRIIWLDPTTENVPAGDFPRAEAKRVMAIRRDEVTAVPRGTMVAVTEHFQTAPTYWRVDGMDSVKPDHHRVVVVPALFAVAWTDLVGVTATPTPNSLTKTTVDGWENAGAVSAQQLASGDGYVEIVASETTTGRIFGLSNGNAGLSLEEIDFALAMFGDGTGIHIFELGVEKLYIGRPAGYAPGDRLRVSIEGGAVTYRHNGTLLYTSLVAPTYPLLVDTSLYHPGATITSAIISGLWS